MGSLFLLTGFETGQSVPEVEGIGSPEAEKRLGRTGEIVMAAAEAMNMGAGTGSPETEASHLAEIGVPWCWGIVVH